MAARRAARVALRGHARLLRAGRDPCARAAIHTVEPVALGGNAIKCSLHGLYRVRLIPTLLGASRTRMERKPNPFTGFDSSDNISMSDLRAIQRPLHIVNTALNLVSTNKLAWQDRQAESFTI